MGKTELQFCFVLFILLPLLISVISAEQLSPDALIREELKKMLNRQLLSESLWTNEISNEIVKSVDRNLALDKIYSTSIDLLQQFHGDQLQETKEKSVLNKLRDYYQATEAMEEEYISEKKEKIGNYYSAAAGRSFYKRQFLDTFGYKTDYNKDQKLLWCGPGDDAPTCETLGTLADTDRCCRKHDHCPASLKFYIPLAPNAERQKECEFMYPLSEMKLECHDYMYSSFTVSGCECDEEFHGCLQDVSSSKSDEDGDMARKMGKIFFNYQKTPCLHYDESKKTYYAVETKKPFVPSSQQTGNKSQTEKLTRNENDGCPPTERCDKSIPFGNCCVPLRGEYRELASRSKSSGTYNYDNEDISRATFNPNTLMRTSVCNHPMINHCDIPAGACGAWVQTHSGEPKQFVVFDQAFPRNISKTSNKC